MQILSSNQLVGQTLGNYRIERFLRQGRLNAIYLARHLIDQRLDALTFYIAPERFSPEARTRFLLRFRKEATAITSLDHPHVLPVYDHGEVGGNPYLVTPYMMHGSLVDLLKRHGKYDHSSILPILEQLVSGLTYGHSKGFIHGTLRPSTIVLSPEDALRVAGFGLMHMLQLSGIESSERPDTPHWHLLSIAETFLVTPEYVAPEVVEGQSIDVRSDIYALGCIVFELLSGHPPFTGKDPLDTINKHLTEAIPLLHVQNPEVPIAVASVVNQALERDPARRFQHALELIEAFRQASRGAVSCAVPDTRRRTKVLKQNEFLQDTPHDGYSSNKWQLVPPIVTGKHLAVRLSEQEVISEMPTQSVNTGHWRTVLPSVTGQSPAVISGKFPSASTSASQKGSISLTPEQEVVSEMPTQSVNTGHWRTVLPRVTGQSPAVIIGKFPSASTPASQEGKAPFAAEEALISGIPSVAPSSQEMTQLIKQEQRASAASGLQSGKAQSIPGSDENLSSLAKAYSWWSQPGVASPPEPQTKQTQLDRPQTPRESLRLTDRDTAKWPDDPSIPYSLSTKFAPASEIASRKVNRRRAIALLAGGGVAAAVGAAALNLDRLQHLFGIAAKQIQTQPNAAKQIQTQPNTAGMQTQSQMHTAQNGSLHLQEHTGTIIGQTSMALNSANSFTNPADGQGSLLIHLPDNRFVAYEKACTHEQVPVAYNPATKQLVCPAHGAIFDPANGGAVVQGPAMKPLPSVKISVNGDGTITAI